MSGREEQIERAVAHYRRLLTAQAERAAALDSAEAVKKSDQTIIGLIGGDGIGPLIVAQAERALETLLAAEIASGAVELRDSDGLTLENRLTLGQSVPELVMNDILPCDALLKGPTTTPSGGTMESAYVTLRRALDLFANVRPVSVP